MSKLKLSWRKRTDLHGYVSEPEGYQIWVKGPASFEIYAGGCWIDRATGLGEAKRAAENHASEKAEAGS
jgi:hypothetical protein